MKRKRRQSKGPPGIYFLQPERAPNEVKIGRSIATSARRRGLQTGRAGALITLGIYCPPGTTADDLPRLEFKIKKRFAEHRIPGGGTEWFYLVPEISSFIRDYCKPGAVAPPAKPRTLANHKVESPSLHELRTKQPTVGKSTNNGCLDIGDTLKFLK